MKLTDHYVDKVLPIKSMVQACDILHEVISNEKDYNRLVQYEQAIYPLLEKRVGDLQGRFDKKEYKIPRIPKSRQERRRYTILKTLPGQPPSETQSMMSHKSSARDISRHNSSSKNGHGNVHATPRLRKRTEMSQMAQLSNDHGLHITQQQLEVIN